jgi:molybdopterin/thiamine biosynthesis adenylyltransferase
VDLNSCLTNDAASTKRKINAMSLKVTEQVSKVAFRVKTCAKPRPLQGSWPPSNVAALLQWQGLLDRLARSKIEHRLLSACAAGQRAAVCVVDSPSMQYAFLVAFHAPKPSELHSNLNARLRLYPSKVHPMMAIPIDDRYTTQRNNPGRSTLGGKRVGLVGCGTIGGFLAELLLKAGAGLEGGELALLDPDILLPQNVGRHRLGLNRVLQNKAVALKDELAAGAPTAHIRVLPVKAEEADLTRFDLLINATGEESLGHYLTQKFTQQGVFVPTLTIWVEGPGVAVRGLLRESKDRACTRCMSDLNRRTVYPVAKEPVPQELAGHGCESLYVPFPASVSVQAACLAADMVSDWLEKMPSPRLRTRVTRSRFNKALPDDDPVRQEDCPACNL